ncbi:MAG: hypothetical protein ACRDFC_05755 [Ignavibacteria bacterium]
MLNKIKLLLALLALITVIGFTSLASAQNGPVLYFCESYGSSGEVSISDRFYPGYLTVMVKCDYELGLRSVSVQFDKYNCRTGVFDYYKKFNYTVKPDMKYIYFERSSENDLSFDSPGIYRVFLLDSNNKTVASGLIEII